MNARDVIYAALQRSAPAAAPTAADAAASLAPLLGGGPSGDRALEIFTTRSRESGTEVLHCEDVAACAAALAVRYGASPHLLCALDDVTAGFGVEAALTRVDPSVRWEPVSVAGETADVRNARYIAVSAGICGAFGGLADSGAVAVSASAGNPRTLSLLPDDSVVLLRRDDILADLSCLHDRVAELLGGEATSAVTLIGGPSRTADIEKVLVNGVHGPRRLLVCVIG